MQQSPDSLRASASKCRDLASSALTPAAHEILSELAEKYEQDAIVAELAEAGHRPRASAFKWTLS